MNNRSFSLLLLALVGCSAESSLVGGRCREGFAESKGECIALADVSSSSSDGTIPRFGEGTPAPHSLSSDPASGPGAADLGSIGGWGSSGGSSGGSSSGSSSGDAFGGAFGGAASASADSGAAALVCDGSLVACRGACISVRNDANNCGACGKTCPSNICVEGECQGALAGDVIVLGHDYTSSSSSSAQAKMIANAISIPTTDPIRVLAFDGAFSDGAAERAVIASTVRFRGVSYTMADDAALEATDLAKSYDVILVRDAGPAASYLGARTRTALETFTKRGGVIVAVDDGGSDMPAFLRDSGLLSIDGHTKLATDTQVIVTAPNDALGVQVLSPYAPTGATVGFVGLQPASDVTVVARANDTDALPTAIHRFIR